MCGEQDKWERNASMGLGKHGSEYLFNPFGDQYLNRKWRSVGMFVVGPQRSQRLQIDAA